jgi:hypothetical protein
VKSQGLAEEAEQIFGEEVNITTEGKRHLGAVIGSKEYKDQYIAEIKSKDGDEISHPLQKSQKANLTLPTLPSRKRTNLNLPTSCEQLRLLKSM